MVSPSGAKYFYIARNISTSGHKKYYRKKIGIFPDLTLPDARAKVIDLKRQIALGHNPFEEAIESIEEITFKELVTKYIEDYAKLNVKRWKEYQAMMDKKAGDLYLMQISLIQKSNVRKIFMEITKKGNLYAANRFLETVRAIFNKAIEWDLLEKNPAQGISLNTEEKRSRFITQAEMSQFLKSLSELCCILFEDFVLMSLLTGARSGNVLAMEWKEVHFEETTWLIPSSKAKNRKEKPIHLVPWAMEILLRRKKEIGDSSKWVFPSETSRSGHYESPKRLWAKLLKRANLEGVRIHDLRRTHGTWMRKAGADREIIGEALNHLDMKSTEIYDIIESDQVKEFREKAMANLMSKSGKVLEGAPIHKIQNDSDYIKMLQEKINELEYKLNGIQGLV